MQIAVASGKGGTGKTLVSTCLLREYFTLSVPAIRNMIPVIHGNDTTALMAAIHI